MTSVRGNPECKLCGGTLTVYGTVDMGPDVSDGEPCLDADGEREERR